MSGELSHVFLLSPANCSGRRAGMLLRSGAVSPLAERLRAGTLTLGEAFSFMSGLYFRGKLTYANMFTSVHRAGGSASYVITQTRGLQCPGTPVSVDMLSEFASTDIGAGDLRYRAPLERDVAALAVRLSAAGRVVLLGSIATGKYADVLAPVLAERLHYPAAFIGRGDMSRGGLLLRSASSGVELEYVALEPGSVRRGKRPPKLAPLRTPAAAGLP